MSRWTSIVVPHRLSQAWEDYWGGDCTGSYGFYDDSWLILVATRLILWIWIYPTMTFHLLNDKVIPIIGPIMKCHWSSHHVTFSVPLNHFIVIFKSGASCYPYGFWIFIMKDSFVCLGTNNFSVYLWLARNNLSAFHIILLYDYEQVKVAFLYIIYNIESM